MINMFEENEETVIPQNHATAGSAFTWDEVETLDVVDEVEAE